MNICKILPSICFFVCINAFCGNINGDCIVYIVKTIITTTWRGICFTSDKGETIATSKSIPSNISYSIRDGEGGKTGATIVSITDYISMLSLLNGRKVKS